MSNDFEGRKNRIGAQLTRRLGHALDVGEITVEDVPNLSDAILETIENAKSAEEIAVGLRKFLTKWPFYNDTIDLPETVSLNWLCLECFSLNSAKRARCRNCEVSREDRFRVTQEAAIEATQPQIVSQRPPAGTLQKTAFMYCPSCGKQIPDTSTFCLHCGKPIIPLRSTQGALGSAEMVSKWESKDFNITWVQGKTGWVSAEYYTEPAARLFYWQNYQSYILSELQELLDDGWQPLGELGPACVHLRDFKSRDNVNGGQAIGLTLWIIGSFGLGLLFLPFLLPSSWKYEMIRFEVKLRRLKR